MVSIHGHLISCSFYCSLYSFIKGFYGIYWYPKFDLDIYIGYYCPVSRTHLSFSPRMDKGEWCFWGIEDTEKSKQNKRSKELLLAGNTYRRGTWANILKLFANVYTFTFYCFSRIVVSWDSLYFSLCARTFPHASRHRQRMTRGCEKNPSIR